MSYCCKKCGHMISHEMMWSARLPYEEMCGRPAPRGVHDLMPTVLPKCPYCGSWKGEFEDDYWFLKGYELRYGFGLLQAVRHQRNVEWEGEMDAEAEVVKGLVIRNSMTDLEYFSTFAEVRKKVKAMKEAGQ